MTAPLPLDVFDRLPPTARASVVEGLDTRIDTVAARAADTHQFLRHGWFAAASGAYGGRARTLLVEQEGTPVLALPFVPFGPSRLGLAKLPGSYWPFRSFPLALDTDATSIATGLKRLGEHVRALRIGPVLEGDPAAEPFLAAARTAGWAVLDRTIARSWVQDLTEPDWPRASTLKKNRFHEKHLATHGTLDWRFLTAADWPTAFDDLAAIEADSWIETRTDGSDAKFTAAGHGAFWRAAAADPVLAKCFRAALLLIDGKPAAFSFDIDVGTHHYAVANSYAPAIAKHSPGRLLHYRNLVDARARQIRTVDWGMGDSGYKQALGAVEGPAFMDWLLLRPGVTALTGRMLARWWGRGSDRSRGQTRE